MARERIKTYWVEVPMLGQKFPVLTSKPETIPGKIMKLDLTRMIRGRSMDANLLIEKTDEGYTSKFLATKVSQSYIKRMMRKNISWIEDSFLVDAEDNRLRIKPFMITKKRVHRSVRKELRDNTKAIIIKLVSGIKTEEVFDAVISGKFQKELISQLKKVYPLAFCEIRMLKIENPRQE